MAVNDAATAVERELLVIDVLANDSDADGDMLSIVALPTLPTKGQAAIVQVPTPHVEYRAAAGATGTDTFTYRISDGNDGEATATITVTIITNDPPVAKLDSVMLFSQEIIELDVLANDSDPDGDTLRIAEITEAPRHGDAEIVTDDDGKQLIQYDPDDDFAGRDSLVYEIADERDERAQAKVYFRVKLNQPPTARPDSVTIRLNTVFEIEVLANDSDPDADPLSVASIVEAPENGTATIVDGTRIRYTPDAGFLGLDRLVYSLSDGIARSGSRPQASVLIQVAPPDGGFEASLSGGNVVPATRSRASGLIIATFSDDQLAISGSFSRLDDVFDEGIGAQIYLGGAGEDGANLFPLTVNLAAGNRIGTLVREENTFTLTDEQVAALFARRLYVVIPSAAFPDGELRGQLLPAGADERFRAIFSGRAATPVTASGARGGLLAERYGNEVVLTGAFRGLESPMPAGAARIELRRGGLGTSGPLLRTLPVAPGPNRLSGTLSAEAGKVTLTPEEVQALREGLLYAVVPTREHPEGEIRAQFLSLITRVFEAALSGENEVPPVASAGFGGVIATVEGTQLRLAGAFAGLESAVDLSLRNGAHIHRGAPDVNGPILFELLPLLDSGSRSGAFSGGSNQFSLSPDQLDSLFSGLLYVNIHTLNRPGGALRGQLLPSANVAPSTTSISLPLDGAAIDLEDGSLETFEARWNPGVDLNGNTLYYRWQLSRDPSFDSVILESGLLEDRQYEIGRGSMVEALQLAGVPLDENQVVFHRVVSTDGSLSTEGPASRLVLGDTPVAVEDAEVPARFAVHGNYPNPFNPATTIRFDLPQTAEVHVELYDLLGRRVLTTPTRALAAGAGQTVRVEAGRLASGVYLYRVIARAPNETFSGAGRLTLVR